MHRILELTPFWMIAVGFGIIVWVNLICRNAPRKVLPWIQRNGPG